MASTNNNATGAVRGGRMLFVVGALAVGLAVLSLISLWAGTERFAFADVARALTIGGPEAADTTLERIVWRLRLPRMLTAIVVGAALAVAGTTLQAVMRNPLAAPNVVGVTAGAGLGASLAFAAGWAASTIALPGLAFVGAFTAAVLVYALAWQPGRGTSIIRLVLSGVALTAILSAFTTFVMIESDRAAEIVGWMAGSLNAASWDDFHIAWPIAFVGCAATAFLWRAFDVLQLGDEAAKGLGLRVEYVRLGGMAIAGLLVGGAVSVAGLIGFVGLIVPHACRMLVGSRHAVLLPVSALGGAVLVLLADIATRTLVGSGELPLGVLTSLIGGPYFLWLLHRARLVR